MKYIVANFKQNFDPSELEDWTTSFKKQFTTNADKQVIIAGGYLHLQFLADQKLNYSVAAQTVSPFASGAHTGQVGASQLKGLVSYCLVGHSETRRELGDTDLEVAKEAKLLLSNNITPIICLDVPYLESQIAVLKNELLNLNSLFFAYEPLSAIGSGHPATPQNANQLAFKIKTLTKNSFPVLYGGSVDPDNVNSFTNQEYIDGVLVGHESLDPQKFIQIIDHV